MPKFYCIHCGQRINAPDERAGTRASCPACKGEIQVPALPPAPEITPQAPEPITPSTITPSTITPSTITPPPITPSSSISTGITPPPEIPPTLETSFWSAPTLKATLGAGFLCLLAAVTRPSTRLELMGFTERSLLTGAGETLGRLIAMCLLSVLIALVAAWIMSAFKKRFADTLTRIYSILILVLSLISLAAAIGMTAFAPAIPSAGGNENSRQAIEENIRTMVKENAPPAIPPLQIEPENGPPLDSAFQKEFSSATAKTTPAEEARIKAKEDDEAIARSQFRKAVQAMIEDNEAEDEAREKTEKERARQALAAMQGDIRSMISETTGPDGMPRKTDFRFEEQVPAGDDIQKLRPMMQSFYNDIIASQNEYATSLENDGLNTLLDADRMYKDKGFKNSLLTIGKMKQSLAASRAKTDKLLMDFPKHIEKYNFTSEVDRDMLKGYQEGLEKALPMIREIWELEMKIITHTEELVGYLKTKRLYWQPKEGKFLFEKDSDLEQFDRIAKKITDCAARQNELREKSMRNSTDKLDSLKERLAD